MSLARKRSSTDALGEPPAKRACPPVHTPYQLSLLVDPEESGFFCKEVERAAAAGVGMDEMLPDGETLLHVMVDVNIPQNVEVLLRHGADPNFTRGDFNTCLHISVLENLREITELLIKYGASVNAINSKCETPISIAAHHRRIWAVKMLIEHGATAAPVTTNPNGNPLWRAAFRQDSELFQLLLCNGALPNARASNMSTPIHVAAQMGWQKGIELLLKHGADINSLRDTGTVPMCAAAMQGHLDTVVYMIRHGADPNRRGHDSATPFLYACASGHLDIITTLARAGATDCGFGVERYRGIDLAIREGHLEVVEWLLENGYDHVPIHNSLNSAPEEILDVLCASNRLPGAEARVFQTAIRLCNAKTVWRVRREGLHVPDGVATGNSLAGRMVRAAALPWSPRTHPLYSRKRRRIVLALFCMNARRGYSTPLDVIITLCQHITIA